MRNWVYLTVHDLGPRAQGPKRILGFVKETTSGNIFLAFYVTPKNKLCCWRWIWGPSFPLLLLKPLSYIFTLRLSICPWSSLNRKQAMIATASLVPSCSIIYQVLFLPLFRNVYFHCGEFVFTIKRFSYRSLKF